MEFYYSLNRLCDMTGWPFDTAFLIGVWGFAVLFYITVRLLRWFFRWLRSRRKKES